MENIFLLNDNDGAESRVHSMVYTCVGMLWPKAGTL